MVEHIFGCDDIMFIMLTGDVYCCLSRQPLAGGSRHNHKVLFRPDISQRGLYMATADPLIATTISLPMTNIH